MDSKWNIMERPGILDKCRQMEATVRKVFKMPNAWANGFVRLVSLEGTWYHHRETDIFIPMEQSYLGETYLAGTKPPKGVLRVRGRNIGWDYMNDMEAIRILPALAALNLPQVSGGLSLSEVCRNNIIFLKDGKVYDGKSKGIHFGQNNEKGTVLQACYLEEQYKRKSKELWYYDIYLWAKAGVIPAVLCSIKDCWNIMQFLRDNFNDIDFSDFLAQEGNREGKREAHGAAETQKAQDVAGQKNPVSARAQETAQKREPEPHAEGEQEPKREPVSGPKIEKESVPEPKINKEPAAESKPEEEARRKEEAQAERKTQPEPVAKPVPEQEIEEETVPEPEMKEEPEPKQEIEKEPAAELKPEEEARRKEEAQAERKAQLESLAEPEPEIEKGSVPEPEIKEEPEQKQEIEKEPVAEQKPEIEEEPVAESKPEEEAARMEEARWEEKAQAERKAQLESVAEPEPEIEKEPDAEPKPEIEEELVPEPEMKEEPEPKLEIEPEPVVEPKPEEEVARIEEARREEEAHTERKAQPEPDAEQKPGIEEELDAEPEPEMKEEPVPEPEMKEEPEPEPKLEIEPEPVVEPKPEEEVARIEEARREEEAHAEQKAQPKSISEPEIEEELVPEIEKDSVQMKEEEEVPIEESEPVRPEAVASSIAPFDTKQPESMSTKPVESAFTMSIGAENKKQPIVAPADDSEEQNALYGNTMLKGQDTHETQEPVGQGQFGRTKKMGVVRGEEEILELLECDKNRCRLEAYDRDILYDIIRGHWELYEETGGEVAAGENGQELIARDPKLDVRRGVIGIDFGTKSTVVVRQDTTNRIIPIRIGTGNLSNEVKDEDFENPSIIEFTNVRKFLEEYLGEEGRPHTSCNDVFVSYDAYEDFRNCKPDDFYAYFSELKQWANHEKGSVVVKDKQREEYRLGQSMDVAGGIVNPIELYAYYIGLYINNMRNGIYLNYLMTFPVGYAKEVRDFVAKSFYEGIKKSLPDSILKDEGCMRQFKVELGISEPAAYAVTALEQSHLEPKDETEHRMYGIFDFGGGTTDFDFGICRGATEEEYELEAYDYVLECFGADSDVTLGGENILELMAYQVYQKNLDLFREKRITFTLPQGETGFAGSETLLINSQIARRNMTILKEELRPLWYQEQGWRKKYQLDSESQNEGVDKEGMVVSLYNMDGEPVPQCILEFSSQELVEMVKNRIQKGVDSFFQCLVKIFLGKEEAGREEDTIYIFLAGNSSKSVFVKELFQRKIEEYYTKSTKAAGEITNVRFELIDPLTGGTGDGDKYAPNAKTGVAYGLLKSREGSSIKIIKNYETDSARQSRFHYYLGRDRRHCFDCRFSPAEVAYKKWVPFQGATKNTVRIYYTNNPMADSGMGQLSIENVPYKEIQVGVKEGAYLFIRTVEPNMVEYAVAKDVEDIADNEIQKCYFD